MQQRVQDLSDIDLKCSEINHLIRKYKEKYDELIANLPSYKDNKDIVYLKRRIEELTSNSAKMEKELVTISEQNKELLEQNSKLFRSASKYKSDIRRIAQILTQQEEIIKKYEVKFKI